jgi:hypothetical protein
MAGARGDVPGLKDSGKLLPKGRGAVVFDCSLKDVADALLQVEATASKSTVMDGGALTSFADRERVQKRTKTSEQVREAFACDVCGDADFLRCVEWPSTTQGDPSIRPAWECGGCGNIMIIFDESPDVSSESGSEEDSLKTITDSEKPGCVGVFTIVQPLPLAPVPCFGAIPALPDDVDRKKSKKNSKGKWPKPPMVWDRDHDRLQSIEDLCQDEDWAAAQKLEEQRWRKRFPVRK